MARDVAPQLISPAGAYDIVNGLLDEDGNPYRRGGTAYKSQVGPEPSVLDNFNRADESPVSQGGEWTAKVFSSDTSLRISENRLAGQLFSEEPASNPLASRVYDLSIADGEVYVTVAELPEYLELYIRTADEGGTKVLDAYCAVFDGSFASLYRVDNAKRALLRKVPSGLSPGDRVKLRAVGPEISMWRKPAGEPWSLVGNASDPTYATGRTAVRMRDKWEENAALDDFGGGALAPFANSGLTWLWDGYLQPGPRTVFASAADFGVLAADDETPVRLGGAGLQAPKQADVLEDLLFIGGGAIYGGSRKESSYSAGTVKVTNGSQVVTGSGTFWTASVDPGMLLQLGDERVYVVSSVESDTQLTLRDAYQGATGEGKAYALRPLYEITSADPYQHVDYLTACANRLVLGSGRTIRFTEVNNPHSTTNSLGTPNEHKLPSGVAILGLATAGDSVLIFTTGGVWALDGLHYDIVDVNGNAQHRLQLLSRDLVLADAAGLAGAGQRLVVPAADGVYLMDGISSPERVSRPIDRLYRKRVVDGYPLGGAVVYRGHYFLPILDTSGDVRDLFVCRLDRPTRARGQRGFPWSRFTGDGGEIAAFAVRSSAAPRDSSLLGAQSRASSRIVDCSHYFEPSEDHALDADGTAHAFDQINRDIQTGGGTENVVRDVQLLYEMSAAPGGEPRLRVLWSDGSLEGGDAEWDEIEWDVFDWVSRGAVFNAIDKHGPPSDGRRREKFRINKRMRYARLRVITEGPVASFALRALQVDVRPSGAVRR